MVAGWLEPREQRPDFIEGATYVINFLAKPFVFFARLLKRAVKLAMLAAFLTAGLVVLDAVFGPDDKDEED